MRLDNSISMPTIIYSDSDKLGVDSNSFNSFLYKTSYLVHEV